ncbi:MAG: tetratricopeptide repeat protein, partial [Muribaculaceae bacterium]|nr:tetratricopeptide repeat protein [Muribaculaceae bacterium]
MDRFVYEDDGEGLSRRDSLIQEMVCFINPENKLSKSMRKAVETRINGFPHKVIRRDTTTYFINAAYAVSYNEFRKHNYKAAKKWVDRFKKYGMPPSFWNSTFGYSSVGLNASSSINAKGGFKAKKRKNVWGLRFSFPKFNSQKFDSIKFDPKRTETKFIEDFIRDLPTDLAFSTYKKLLIYYKDREGILTYLNGFGSPSFVQRCVENGREDIFLLVCDIWNADPDDFKTNEWGYFGYYPDKEKKETANIFSFDSRYSDIDYKKAEIDSIISSNHRSKLGNKITWLLNLYYNRSCYSDILNACQTYKFNIEEAFFPRFNNYWGLALAKLGRYEEALPYFDLAFLYSSNEEYRNVYKINKAYSLGESGRTKEAAQLLMSERNNLKDSYSKFCWYDNLGYVYSRQDPDKSLTYYEEADKYLDKWSIYTDLIVRHLCREAAEQNDMYIKRSFIDEAVRIGDTRVIRDRNVTGMAQTELGVLGMMAFDYDKADRCFIKADSLLRNLSAEDARRSYLNNNRAINLVYQGRYGEAIEILKKQLTLQAKVYDSRHPEYE